MSNQHVQIRDRDGSVKWVKGVLHHAHDPALVTLSGDKYWYKDGVIHRDGGLPAIVKDGGKTQYWIEEGKYHRDGDKPAIIVKTGRQEWFLHGKRHRDVGPALIDPKTKTVKYYHEDEEYSV